MEYMKSIFKIGWVEEWGYKQLRSFDFLRQESIGDMTQCLNDSSLCIIIIIIKLSHIICVFLQKSLLWRPLMPVGC